LATGWTPPAPAPGRQEYRAAPRASRGGLTVRVTLEMVSPDGPPESPLLQPTLGAAADLKPADPPVLRPGLQVESAVIPQGATDSQRLRPGSGSSTGERGSEGAVP